MRLNLTFLLHFCFILTIIGSDTSHADTDDPYLWMEEVDNEEALAWAKAISDHTTTELEAVAEFGPIHEQLLEIYNSQDRIPMPALHGDWVYNFWRDADHVRGLWRRTTLASYQEDKPEWEPVLDLDALAEVEGENWVWKGATFLAPDERLALVRLSRGGADAVVLREFDTVARAFVDDGFVLPESKVRVSWLDQDTLFIGTDFGEGSMTDSGYPRRTQRWKRGQPVEESTMIHEGAVEDVSVSTWVYHRPHDRYVVVRAFHEFFRSTFFLFLEDRLVHLDIPADAELKGFFKDKLVVHLRSPWTPGDQTYPADALLALDLDTFLQGNREFEPLFQPTDRVAFDELLFTRDHIVFTTLDNVVSRLYQLELADGTWKKTEVDLPGLGAVQLRSYSETQNLYFFTYTDFVTPTSLFLVQEGAPPINFKSSPAWFDTEGVTIEQHEALSKDGTHIPYFLLKPRGYEANGANPTLLYAYGGFEVSMRPYYSGTLGSSWVERGGVYALANIRGGGEFGPQWHQAALRENRQKNFDDLIAVAEDLVKRGVTTPAHLGIEGGSQGGLLVSGAFTQRPDLFNAVVSAVPLADMKRYNKLLAGASWMAEYGNPDTEDWEYIKHWSPYHNLSPEAEYPPVFFWTNTRDDRVHPAHARKMVARLQEYGKPVYYYENTEGGHGGATNLKQSAYIRALTYAYLWKRLR